MDTLVLTANRRLAEIIRQDYAAQQQIHNLRVWETPAILPLRTWLQTLWRSHPLESDLLLTPRQEQQLWSEIIQETCHSTYPLLHVDNTVQLVQRAWELFNHWELSLEMLKSETTSAEVSLFVHWVEQFIDRCRRQHWLSEAELPLRLQLIRHAPSVKKIVLTGFDEISPAYERLFKTHDQSTTVEWVNNWHPYPMGDRKGERAERLPRLPPCDGGHSEHRLCRAQDINSEPLPLYSAGMAMAPSLESEIMQMAQWAKKCLEASPRRHIGCIVPQLTTHRSLTLSIFTRIFAPENLLPGVLPSELPFNISGGQSLDQFEIIRLALRALSLDPAKIAIESLSYLLQSPYLCQNESDINLGAQLDAQCRGLGGFELPLTVLFSAMAHCQADYPGHTWLQRWRAHAALSTVSESLQLPSAWAEHFSQQLTALGWPGGRSLNSLEYQLIQRWRELLVELAELDMISGNVTRTKALHCLQRLAAQTIFQPQTESKSPIQILGVLESSGFYFDAMWVMGMDDRNWPPPAEPNPFLPYPLQTRRQMPHASTQRELIYAQRITQRLLNSAGEIWLSCSPAEPDQPVRFSRLVQPFPLSTAAMASCLYPAHRQSRLLGMKGEERSSLPLRPPSGKESSLQRELPRLDPEMADDPQNFPPFISYAENIFVSARKETLPEEQAPEVALTEKIGGGSGILTRQAECPFRAFATFRLNAVALEEPSLGISARQHGILIHNALEYIWKTLGNQQNLLKMNDAALQKMLTEIVDCVSEELLLQQESPFTSIEKKRLITLLTEWLALEKKRPPFQVIEQETEHTLELSGLRLRMKIDRIDQLENGGQLLIDYKTGLTSIQDWLTERLRQPQLPLYALNIRHSQKLVGLAFAQLHVSKPGFKGLHEESLDTARYFPSGIINVDSHKEYFAPRTWTELLKYWRTALEKLADEFQHGFAEVDPADNGTPCQTCDLQSLCRVQL